MTRWRKSQGRRSAQSSRENISRDHTPWEVITTRYHILSVEPTRPFTCENGESREPCTQHYISFKSGYGILIVYAFDGRSQERTRGDHALTKTSGSYSLSPGLGRGANLWLGSLVVEPCREKINPSQKRIPRTRLKGTVHFDSTFPRMGFTDSVEMAEFPKVP